MREHLPIIVHTPEQSTINVDTVLGVGKRAVSSLIQLAPKNERLQQVDRGIDFAASTIDIVRTVKTDINDAYQRRSELMRGVGNHVASAALETGKAGAQAALRFVMSEYGIGRKLDGLSGNERLRILDTYTFGQRVLGTLLDPKTRLTKLAVSSLGVAKEAAKQEATFQLSDARNTVSSAASDYLDSLRAA